MNKERRKELARALALLEEAKPILESCAEDERQAFDNLTEGLQQGERGQQWEANAEALDEVVSSIGDAIDRIGEVE